jgi:hypothetical protein
MKTSKDLLNKYANSKSGIVLDGADFISQRGYTLIPNYVLHTDALSAYAKIVYAMILSYAWGQKNTAFPGQEQLGKDCGLGLRSVKYAVKELNEKKFITVIRRGLGKTNVYVLHFKRRSVKDFS